MIITLLSFLLSLRFVNIDGKSLPNILIIVADDLGYNDIGSYGSVTISTPNIDKIAIEGMKMTQFYSTAPLCSSSRAALLTGRFPQRTGVYTNHTYPKDLRYRVFYPSSLGSLPHTELTLATLLKSKGYYTKLVGKWHLGHFDANLTQIHQYANENDNILNEIHNNHIYETNDNTVSSTLIKTSNIFNRANNPLLNEFNALPTDRGFDSFFGLPYSHEEGFPGPAPEGWVWPPIPLMRDHSIVEQPVNLSTLTNQYTQEAVDFLYNRSESSNNNGNKPWFMYYGFEQPHIPLFRSPGFKNISRRGTYGDTVQELDYNIGVIFDTLKKTGFDNNTLIIITSDNGAWIHPTSGSSLDNHNTYPFDGGSNAPFRGGKGSTWEGGVHVPAIFYWKDMIPANSVCMSPIYNMDILPTIAEYLNITLPTDRTFDGSSILSNILSINGCPVDRSNDPHTYMYYWRETLLYAVRYQQYKAHYITRKGFGITPPIKHDPPLLYNIEWDPSESIKLNTSNPYYSKIIKLIDNAKTKIENDVYNNMGYPQFDEQSWLVVPCCEKGFNETESKEYYNEGQLGLALWDMCVCDWKPWSKETWNR